ncbi:MAG: sigma-70 family RNA polymerase sigma factor [Pseudomonadales bacterium]|nr:sigma-70 family RNA polymerase sigma factor [Pseudomonadales bacterium]
MTTDNKKDTDEQLVERVLKGEKHAFNLLVLRHQYGLLGLIGRMMRNQHDAEDVVQDAFLKAYRGLASFRHDSSFFSWVYRIAINNANNHMQRQRSHLDIDDAGERADIRRAITDIESPELNHARDAVKAAIDRVLRKMPEDLRTAYTLREFHELSYEEIAELVGSPVGTVRSRIFRARETLDAKLRRHWDRDTWPGPQR